MKAHFRNDHKELHDYLDDGGVAILMYADMKRDPPNRFVMLNVPDMSDYWLRFLSQGWNGFKADCERMNVLWIPVEHSNSIRS